MATFKADRVAKQVVSLMRGDSNAAAVFQTIGVRILLLVTNFGTGVIVARSLGPFGRGELAVIGLWPGFLATLATLGIPTALSYHTRRQPENSARNYAASIVMMVTVGILIAGVGALIMPLLLHGYDERAVRTAQAFMVFAPQILLGYAVRAHLESIGEFRRSILAQLYPTMGTLLSLIVLRAAGNITVLSAALSYSVPFAVQTLWLVGRLWPKALSNLRDCLRPGRELLSYGLRSYGTDIVGTLSSQLDFAVIVLFLDARQLGLYSIALTLSRLLNIIQNSLISVIFPRASSLEPEAAFALISRTARLSMVASIGLGAVFLLIVPFVLTRVYGAEFGAAIALMPLLTAEAIIGGLGGVLKQSFLASGRPFVVTLIEAGSIVLAVGLLFVLVPRMNTLGAATALLLTSIVRVAVIMAAYRFVLGRPIPRLLPDGADFAYVRLRVIKQPEPRAV